MDGKWAKNELLVILRSEAANSKPSKIWLYPFPERVMTHICKSNSARHREQQQGADFVHVGCFHPSILRHFQFFPIQPMISTGPQLYQSNLRGTPGTYAGFHPISLRPDEIKPPGPPGRSSWRSLLLWRSRGPNDGSGRRQFPGPTRDRWWGPQEESRSYWMDWLKMFAADRRSSGRSRRRKNAFR